MTTGNERTFDVDVRVDSSVMHEAFSVEVVLSRCEECAALLLHQDQDTHDDWHRRIRDIF